MEISSSYRLDGDSMNAVEFEEVLARIEKLSNGAQIRTVVQDETILFIGEEKRRAYKARAKAATSKMPRKTEVRKPSQKHGKNHSKQPKIVELRPKKGSSKRLDSSLFRDGTRETPVIRRNPVIELNLNDVDISDEEFEVRFKLATEARQVGHLPPIKLMQIGGSQHYELVEDYAYHVDYFAIQRNVDFELLKESKKGVPHLATITAKAGFQFDRSSIPRIFWLVISKDNLSNVPPLFHDLLYRFAGKLPKDHVDPYTIFTRDEADYLFRHLMERSGVQSWRITIAYQAVKLAGTSSWGAK